MSWPPVFPCSFPCINVPLNRDINSMCAIKSGLHMPMQRPLPAGRMTFPWALLPGPGPPLYMLGGFDPPHIQGQVGVAS